MRARIHSMIASALAGALLATAALAQQPRAFEKLAYPKLNEIKQPEVTRATLPNGMRVIMIEDHEFPTISMRALVRGGRVAEPTGKAGLAELFGTVHRTGGTKTVAGDTVDEKLERIGASIETSVGEAYGVVGASTLTEHFDAVLPLFAEFMTAPAFADDKVELAKTHLRSVISRRNDQVMAIAQRELAKLVFGPSSPYARQFEYADIDRLTRDDLVAFHSRYYRPDMTILAVWGDFKAADMQKRIETAFSSWQARGTMPAVSKPRITAPTPSINYIEKKDVEQTFIVAAQLGLRWDDPDYPAVYVLSDVLGGGFASRLFVKIRTEKGLAYGAGGWMSPAYDHQGTFSFFTSTKPASTAEALSTMLDEIRRIRTEPVTEAELSRAKDSYLNSYAFEYDSTDKVVNRLLTYEFYSYPVDFNVKLRDAIEKVSADDVLRAAQKHLDPAALTILAIGRQEQFDKPLATFGKVTTIDITIPEPKEAVAEATTETLARGKALLAKAAARMGEAALKGLTSVASEGTNTVKTPMGELELKASTVFVLPDKVHAKMTTPMGPMVQVFDGQRGWMQVGPQTQDLPESMAGEMRTGLYTELGCALILKEFLAGRMDGAFMLEADFEGKPAADVVVRVGDTPVHLLIDPATGDVVGTKRTSMTQEGPAEVVEIFGGWQEVSGLRVPFESQQKVKGEVKSSGKLASLTLNQPVNDDLFVRAGQSAAK